MKRFIEQTFYQPIIFEKSNFYNNKGSAAFCSELPKLYSLLVHDMRLKMVQIGHVSSSSTLAHKFVVVLQFQNML